MGGNESIYCGCRNYSGLKLRGIFSWNMLWLALFLICIGVFIIFMPKGTDDYEYMRHLKPWFDSQGVELPEYGGNLFKAGVPKEAIIETIRERYYSDNIRLGNVIAPLMLTLPKVIGSGVMALLFVAITLWIFKISGIRIRRSPLVPIGIFMLALGLPWKDSMGSLDFQLNYIVPTFLNLQLLLLVKSIAKKEKKLNVLERIGLLILVIITAAWHEGFAIPMLFGLLALMVFKKRLRHVVEIEILVAGIIIGLFYLILSPGLWTRAIGRMGASINPDISTLVEIWPMLLALFIVLVLSLKRGFRELLKDEIIICGLVMIVVSAAMYIQIGMIPRSCWWGNIVSIIVVLRIINRHGGIYRDGYSIKSGLFGAMILMIVYAHLGAADYYVLRLRKDMLTNLQIWTQSPGRSLFTTMPQFSEMPLICGYLPDYRLLGGTFDESMAYYVDVYYENNGKIEASLRRTPVPERLRNVTMQSGKEVAGAGGVREYQGALYVSADSIKTLNLEPSYLAYREIDYGKGYVDVTVLHLLFESEADGKKYYYLKPHTDWYVSHFKKIKRISRSCEKKLITQ